MEYNVDKSHISAILFELIKYYILKELKDLNWKIERFEIDQIPSKVLWRSLRSFSFAFSSWEHGFLILARAHQSSCISSSQCKHFEETKKWQTTHQEW